MYKSKGEKVAVKKLQADLSNMKSVEIELSEKDKEIQSMKQKYDEMSVTLQNILSVIGNVEQPTKNKNSKAANHERRIQTRSQ
jgi:hypothetical protein